MAKFWKSTWEGVNFQSPKRANKSQIVQKLCFVAFHVYQTLTAVSNGLSNDVGPRVLTPGALFPKVKM